MTIFGQGEPTQVGQFELGYFYALAVLGPTHPNRAHLFVQKCLQIRKSPIGKILVGGMIIILICSLGIEFLEDYKTNHHRQHLLRLCQLA